MKLYNSSSRTVEEFKPLNDKAVSMYACGPTVYDDTHIGHMRRYVMDDIIRRTFLYLGYKMQYVMNVTDVGHLTGDDDSGEDKLEKGARKAKKTVYDIVEYYTKMFFVVMKELNVLTPDIVPKATEHVEDMIALITNLEKKGYIYETDQAVYFDVRAFQNYGALSGQKIEEKKIAVREDVHEDKDKRHPVDFVVWFKRVGRFKDHVMHWPSPWGDGFPGWHIECSAMSMKYLGKTLDLHSGGIDHIPVHHENEIAQSEAATKNLFVRYWLHHNFLLVEGEKMSKSLGNFVTLDKIQDKGIDPRSLRLLFMQTHYRSEMNFTWDSAIAAGEAFQKLKKTFRQLTQSGGTSKENSPESERIVLNYKERFESALSNDFNTAEAVALMWQMVKDHSIRDKDKAVLLIEFDNVFGFDLVEIVKDDDIEIEIPEHIQKLAKQRYTARKNKDFKTADALRDEIIKAGYEVEDSEQGTVIRTM